MNLRSLGNNVIDSLKTTRGIRQAYKKLAWLYNIRPGAETEILFSYPAPAGNITLGVRSNNGSDVFIVSEVFKERCYQLSLPKTTRYIIDLGANAGFTAVYFSKLFPQATIACVEPMPNNVSILKQNLAANNVNAIVKQAAISVNDGNLAMDISANDYGHKVHDISFGKDVGSKTITVEAISLNTLIKELGWSKIDLLKIDIEGYEGVLLRSNTEWLNLIDTIIMELHEGIMAEDVNVILAPYAFKYMMQRKGNWIFSKHSIE